MVGVVSALLVFLAVLLLPPPDKRIRVTVSQLEQGDAQFDEKESVEKKTPAARLESSRLVNLIIGIPGLIWLVRNFWSSGFNLTLDTVNFSVLILAVLAYPSPRALVRAAQKASTLLHGIILQFPLYAGMYGIIKDSGLARAISEAFVSIATPKTFTVIVFWYSSVLNYFVPSGGSKWVIEAPYLLDAASKLGVDTGRLVVSYAFGDMGTNLIQPFWALPLLAVAKLDFRDILGFEILFCAVYLVLVSIGLWFW
jgi:short-chain fatty acids transporter